jgi:outer membrane immunogenic protein
MSTGVYLFHWEIDMRRIFIGSVAIASLLAATSVFAADLPARTYTKAPVMVDPGWSGFYIGGNVGYSWGRSGNAETFSNLATGAALFTNTSRNDVNGVIGGGQVGYNWQSSNWLFGLEADIQGSGEKGSSTIICVACGDGPSNITSNLTQKLDWFGTVRGRAGVLVTPAVLLYATGGLAYGEVETGGTITGPTLQAPLATVALPGASSTRVGWTAGAGVEGRISGNWTAKLEYLYMDLGTVDVGPTTTTIVNTLRRPVAVSYSSHFTDNILRVGLNYHFSGPVARY